MSKHDPKVIPVRDPQILIGATRDFLYLTDQIVSLFYWLYEMPKLVKIEIPPVDMIALKNSLVESALLSVRVLNEFFKPIGAHETDIRSNQFTGYVSQGPFLSPTEAKEIHQRLAHLTVARALDYGKGWSHEMFARALKACDHFLTYLQSHPEYIPTGMNIEDRLKWSTYVQRGIQKISKDV
jgi:hypothetical protein